MQLSASNWNGATAIREPLVTLPGPMLEVSGKGSEPTYLPSVAAYWC